MTPFRVFSVSTYILKFDAVSEPCFQLAPYQFDGVLKNSFQLGIPFDVFQLDCVVVCKEDVILKEKGFLLF